MTKRLSGDEYRAYWESRMSSGPEEASYCGHPEDVDPQAELFFAAIKQPISDICYREWKGRVLEFGSGWGRMLSKLRSLWPHAHLIGIEMCRRASVKSWRDEGTDIFRGEEVPGVSPVDVAITCTALQHVTDDEVFTRAALSIERTLKPGGRLVCLENVMTKKAEHMRADGGVDGYMEAFPGIAWSDGWFTVSWRGEPHAVMFGVKKGAP